MVGNLLGCLRAINMLPIAKAPHPVSGLLSPSQDGVRRRLAITPVVHLVSASNLLPQARVDQ
jgi:hypothetical protein